MTIAAAVLAAPVVAQSTPAPQPQETVGPRELRDFSLPGSTPAPATPPAEDEPPASEPPEARRPPAPATRPPARVPGPQSRAPAPETQPATLDVAEAPLDIRTQPEAIAPAAPAETPYVTQPVPQPVPPAPVSPRTPPRHNRTMLLWLAAALVGCGAALYALRRRRTKIALANAASLEAFVPAEPPPAPPAPVPSRTALDPEKPASRTKPGGSGLVSARLRPQLDLQISPLRGIIDDRQATIEFSVVAFNKGNAPARDVRIEVAMINASPSQDQEIGRFFDEPAGVGEPIEGISPMSHVNLTSRVTLPLDQVRALEVAGRRLFVPLLAFNALYRWSGGEGQTSRSYLIGREGDGEKLAPIRLDLGPRIFRNLGARLHHLQVQR